MMLGHEGLIECQASKHKNKNETMKQEMLQHLTPKI